MCLAASFTARCRASTGASASRTGSSPHAESSCAIRACRSWAGSSATCGPVPVFPGQSVKVPDSRPAAHAGCITSPGSGSPREYEVAPALSRVSSSDLSSTDPAPRLRPFIIMSQRSTYYTGPDLGECARRLHRVWCAEDVGAGAAVTNGAESGQREGRRRCAAATGNGSPPLPEPPAPSPSADTPASAPEARCIQAAAWSRACAGCYQRLSVWRANGRRAWGAETGEGTLVYRPLGEAARLSAASWCRGRRPGAAPGGPRAMTACVPYRAGFCRRGASHRPRGSLTTSTLRRPPSAAA